MGNKINFNKELTVLIPIIQLRNTEEKKRLEASIGSTEGVSTVIVGDKKAIDSISDISLPEYCKVMVNTSKDKSYAGQVNFATKNIETKYISVLEYDDRYTNAWLTILNEYANGMGEDVFAFLPLTAVIDNTNSEVLGFSNEAVWAPSFSQEIGFLDLESFEDYMGFNASGMIFKRDEFIALGALKASMKLSYWYEFILRALYKKKVMYVLPKIMYEHYINVPGSMTEEYNKTMTPEEADWWIELAKKEYFFPQDRHKTYNPDNI